MLNMDRKQPLSLALDDIDWQPSPLSGVWRKPLEREAAESGWVTSVVRYAPNSHFSPHLHPLGEEILVLEGVFSDERGDYPAGSYLRNPPGSSHAPFSLDGCVIFVKLNQFSPHDNLTVARNTLLTTGLQRLHRDQSTYLFNCSEQSKADQARQVTMTQAGLVELLVVSGTVSITSQETSATTTLTAMHWLRLPNAQLTITLTSNDASVWIKLEHADLTEPESSAIGD
uniref:cupin domain-containing protein n=1 Tax=Thaumasiovibrio occultus TaxID=1891184 RepID=UPI000B34CA95|nr:cupin domain-containing protein [Thaumasiovibrio occultus]